MLATAARQRCVSIVSRSHLPGYAVRAAAQLAAHTPRTPAAPPLSSHSRPQARPVCSAAGASDATMSKAEAPIPWPSPITSDLIVKGVVGLRAPTLLPNGAAVWVEARPSENGRSVLVHRSTDGSIADITPSPDSGFNVRTRVHEYGGGEYVAAEDGTVYFSNFADQRLYVQRGPGSAPERLTAESAQLRFADALVDGARGRLVVVVEDHSHDGQEAINTIGAVDLSTGAVTTLASGRDFYMSPALNADGTKMAWVEWNHPNMPWDDTELMVADVAPDGSLTNQRKVAGGKDESVQQPRWGADGKLYFISDAPSGWWNLYREDAPGQVTGLAPRQAEFAGPAWVFGARSYALLPDGQILAVAGNPSEAGSSLVVVNPADGSVTNVDTGLTSFGRPEVLSLPSPGGSGTGFRVLLVGASASRKSQVLLLEVGSTKDLLASTPGDWQVLKSSSDLEVDSGYLSEPVSIEYPTTDGRTAFMNFYAPHNKDYQLPPDHKPALLVKIHGGPTSSASTALNLGYQFWTSRGFAIADINYGGSTGFGRDYRNRLRGNWGIVDVDDCCNAAKYLAEQGHVDPKRMCIDGGSAGGYTTLAALAFRDVFSAGASHYGVADTELLAKDTHKFESRYLDSLIGPYPEAKELYIERSPIHKADNIKAPLILFQGDEDKVVPPEQAELMYEAVKAKGLPTALVMYKGEQHGFRKAENIRSALEGEMFFYGKVLNFDAPYDPELQPIQIDNLKGAPA